MLRKELRMVEQFPGSSRTFAQVLPSFAGEELKAPEEPREPQKEEYDQLLTVRNAQEATGLEEYNRWTVYDTANPSSSKAVFNRRYPSNLDSLQDSERFYEELKAYKKQWASLSSWVWVI